MIYWIAWGLWNLLQKISFPVKVSGRENLPASGAFILASNHLSNLDPMIIGGSLPRPLCYMAKDSLFKKRIFGLLLDHVGAFPVKRDSADTGAIKEALKRLKAGTPLVVFPEGTRHVSQKQNNPGVAFLAIKSGVPVVPVWIEGSAQVLPPRSKALRRHLVTLRFGKPRIFSKSKDYQDTAQQILKAIYELDANIHESVDTF